MTLLDKEKKYLHEIIDWEEAYFEYDGTDFERAYQKWIEQGLNQLGENRQKKIVSSIDSFLFYLQSIVQNSSYHEEAVKRLIDQAKVFNSEIELVEDLKLLSMEQMNFMANQQVAKQRLLSFGQGGLSGFGGILLLGLDLPAMLIINLRAIQLTGLSYGYNLKRPFEMVVALKLFHVATLPKELQKYAWDELWSVVDNHYDELFYDGSEEITDLTWIQQPVRQLVKVTAISLLRKKLIQGLPLIGMAVGASVNYQFTKQITEVAQRFYQKRHLLEKQ
ncbi:EcsC family protein [Bacillus alkalicellulosilyticus]|uniref:EcsC family protein n=1 Tax=Alkalihalobacterium alkalicellulosilyticum TaxID=1912214 RepID=UPI00099773C6|nr:EcsC family protein [Bacillus alkalicellulosilyticus]